MNTSLVSSSSVFKFDAEHNGVPCIASIRPEDQGTEHQFWFTRKMLSKIFDVGRDTINRHVESLIIRGAVTDTQNCVSVMLPDSFGRECVKTTLYDLKVFNYLVMRLDTDKAWEKKELFNDILVEKETKKFPIPETFEDALILAGQQMKLAKEEERKRIQAEQERDEAIRTKAFISSKREATAMATAKAEKAKRIALEERIGEGTKWMSSAQLIKNYNIIGANGKIMNPRSLTNALKKRNCTCRKSDVPDGSGYPYTIFLVSDALKALKLD